jgi:hypothetical protein
MSYMKLFLLTIAFLITGAVCAQSTKPAIGDNVIEIASSSDSAMYRQIDLALIDLGYTFKREFGTFKTDGKRLLAYRGFLLTANISVRDGKVRITGALRNNTDSPMDPGFAVEYRNKNVTMHRHGFLELMELAQIIQKNIPQSTVTYSRQ